MRRRLGTGRLILFIVLILAITLVVLGGAVTLLPSPPEPPTPTPPFFLGHPESLPRLAY
ncbi:MAG: hypothetical protein KatS3mg051_0034 [Anaerolineae bacterium]|nr:MAG: hypothetical protein KatS3mg051_0034 [Anaerolineae bacterium]